MLAAQVETLASRLGHDYSVYRYHRPPHQTAYRIRFVSGEGTRGGRRRTFQARLHRRAAFGEWVYRIQCGGLHNFLCGDGTGGCHNTNAPEDPKPQNSELMGGFRGRTDQITVP